MRRAKMSAGRHGCYVSGNCDVETGRSSSGAARRNIDNDWNLGIDHFGNDRSHRFGKSAGGLNLQHDSFRVIFCGEINRFCYVFGSNRMDRSIQKKMDNRLLLAVYEKSEKKEKNSGEYNSLH